MCANTAMQLEDVFCGRCGKRLTSTTAINNGIGAICFKKIMDEPIKGQLDIDEVIRIEKTQRKQGRDCFGHLPA